MKYQRVFTLMELAYALFLLTVILLGGLGYIFNIVELVAIASDPITGMFILRIVGIFFFPLGCILGWL